MTALRRLQISITGELRVALTGALILGSAASAAAHTVDLTRAKLTFATDGTYRLEITCDLPAYVMLSQPGHLEKELADEFRTMPAADLAGMLSDARQSLKQRIRLDFDGRPSHPEAIDLPALEKLRAQFQPAGGRLFAVVAAGTIPLGAMSCTVTFPAELEAVTLVVDRPGGPRWQQLLRAAATSNPIALGVSAGQSGAGQSRAGQSRAGQTDAAQSSAVPSDRGSSLLRTAWDFLRLGFEHILPEGPDHVLFVLGLFLLSPRLKPLLWQVTAFTVAHSVTLILSSYEKISLPAAVVEPLIALSISLIAVENIFSSRLHAWRVLVVFGFGLLHGLGFAGVLAESQLPPDAFLTALVSFNVGVELGQLAVIALAMLAVGWLRDRPWYRARIVIPASCLIALVGLYWTIERIAG